MQLALHKSWHTLLKDELAKPYIKDLKMFLNYEEEHGSVIYPPADLIFNAFLKTPYENVKVVLMGQDPYHGPGQAHGLCFSVQHGVKPPPSLKNIYKEMEEDLGIPPREHGCLEGWAEQGVLMLNATLTVRAREPRSHYGKGWETFTDSVIEKLRDREEPLIFMLWGKSAQEKCDRILSAKEHKHLVLTAAHPSPYSATKFFGCKHFSTANKQLQKWGKQPIDWSV